MISEKEMMIVGAVNELKAVCAPSNRCKTVYRVGDGDLNFGMDVTEDTVCTIEECIGCIREMSEGAFVPNAKQQGINMKNKHPHHDLIVEWAKDTSKQLQGRRVGFGEWLGASVSNLTDADPDYEFRFKPREFIKGHWYPCVKSGSIQVLMWTGFDFSTTSTYDLSHSYKGTYFDDIGQSLGEIKFGSKV